MKELLGKTLGNYQLQRILGQGRMGVVFLALDRALLRPTALKIMAWTMENGTDQDPSRWFLSEARSVARISHPNVVQIYNIAKHGEYRYIAMEFVDGESAEKALMKSGYLSQERATDILLQTAAALGAAHLCGVVHRDVKPANILLRDDGMVKLSDFGMAQSSYVDAVLSAKLRVGTPFFNAPETWGGAPATAASDIYALGVTYFWLLTGRLPFEANNMQDLQWKHIHEPAPDPRKHVPSLPMPCVNIIERCLHKNPGARYASAAELEADARAMLDLSYQRKSASVAPLSLTAKVLGLTRSRCKPASDAWADAFHFEYDPFSAVDPLRCPYIGEPFEGVYAKLVAAVRNQCKIIVVHGKQGAGKSTLLQRCALQVDDGEVAVYLSGNAGDEHLSYIENLCRLANIDPFRDSALEDLSTWLSNGAGRSGRRVLIFLDDCEHEVGNSSEVDFLIEHLTPLENISLIIAGDDAFARSLQPKLVAVNTELLHLPALNEAATIEYIRSWIRRTLAPSAPLLFISTDACLLIAGGAAGYPGEINRNCRRALKIAALRKRKIVTTWEAWLSVEMQSSADKTLSAAHAICPSPWPTPQVLGLINERRSAAGIPPINHQTVSRARSTAPDLKEEGGTHE